MKKTPKIFSLFSMISFAMAAFAQGPNNSGTYYSNADGKKGAALKTALYSIIKSPKVTSYDGLIKAYEKTDTRSDGCVRDWYSNATNYRHGSDANGNYKKEGDCYNREHSVPQSWFSKSSPMKSDIVHVLPTDGYVNSRRSSYPLAEVGEVEWSSANGYCKLGSCRTPGYTGKVFEPNDEIKGDMARIYFYMVTCYEDRATSWGHVFSSNKAQGFDEWYLQMLLRWSQQDPIDEVEIARNNAVYKVQGNRNPFVDYPNLEQYIWGTKKEVAFSYDDYDGTGTGTGTGTGDDDYQIIAQPVFTPEQDQYTDRVTVAMTSATTGATIYYTTDGTDATTGSQVYSEPITLTATTTLHAIAAKDGVLSAQASATYTVIAAGDKIEPNEVMIALNSTFFNCNYSGAIQIENDEDLVGTEERITVTYSLDEGKNRFCDDTQIRIYPSNRLVIQSTGGIMCRMVFTEGTGNAKSLSASVGTMDGMTWTGAADSVVFYYEGNSKHVRLASVKVAIAVEPAGIEELADERSLSDAVWTTLSGLRTQRPRSGLFIRNGKKVLIR